jgi:four helix bundle protein
LLIEVKSFEDLNCWKISTDLRRTCSKIVKSFPQDEKYKLVDQIVRASRSVTANIAEGFGRYRYQEYIQFCRQSRGSLYELIDHFIVARDEGYISELEFSQVREQISNALAVLNGFINYLLKAKGTKNLASDPEVQYSKTPDYDDH